MAETPGIRTARIAAEVGAFVKPDINTQIIQAYAFGLSMKDVAKLTGTSKATVAKTIIRAGVEKRPPKPPVSVVKYPPGTPTRKVVCWDTEQQYLWKVSCYESAKDLRKLTMRALEAIAKREGWPIGMSMAMCGLNPESRAVIL